MIQNVLRDIGGIGLYGVVSVCLFSVVFSVAFIRACLLKKSFLKSMSALPLEDGLPPSPNVPNVLWPVASPEPARLVHTAHGSSSGDGRAPARTPAGPKGDL
jgi:hypothetical protein